MTVQNGPRLRHLFLPVIAVAVCGCDPQKQTSQIEPGIVARSHLSDGDLMRLQRVLAKARRGEPITIGVIGGSITRGERATTPDRQYDGRVARWWMDQFPKTPITLVNAGVSGTSSMYGCLRVQRDLLSKHPDFVIVEFGVNDPGPPPDLYPDDDGKKAAQDYQANLHAQTYEGVVRQLLADPDLPAVMLLFLMHTDGTNAQQLQSEIGRRYQLPMISCRDAIWPEIAAGRMQSSDYFYDHPHPNDRGHAAIATFIISLLQQTLDHLPVDSAIPSASSALPTPYMTDLFAHASLINAGDLHPVVNDGWSYDPAHDCWHSGQSGSAIEFDVTGQSVDLLYEKQDGGTATAWVTVDGGMPFICATWLGGWGPLCQVDRVILGSSSKKHHVRIRVLTGKSPLGGGNEFQILGLGVAGRGN